ncbi:MAG: hypothetical protein C0392_01145 [Syntrophus sp. (in: bacteria)]|nr:hypothetical protein [Syntrophus sp. (in: bacteria)]
MHIYKHLIILIASSLILTASLYAGLQHIKIQPLSFSREKELANFSFDKINMAMRAPVDTSGLKCPVGIISGPSREFPRIPLSEMALGPPIEEKRVSLILIKNGQKTALINNQFVREGDTLDKARVLRIEKDRVLVGEGGVNKWLSLGAEERGSLQKDSNAIQHPVPDQKSVPLPSEVLLKGIKADQEKIIKQIEGIKQ